MFAEYDKNIKKMRVKVFIPLTLIPKVFAEFHDDSGHLGREKTYYKILTRWYRPGLYSALTNYLKSCMTCLESKPPTKGKRNNPLQIPQRTLVRPMSHVCLDISGPWPTSSKGNMYVAVLV
ncbi:MAG: integrase zinc binding domain-containing protein, partial [Anaerolineales bacterium]|nr:integrase zinc binding domain-containing protein [Anaerolineales bacterium]